MLKMTRLIALATAAFLAFPAFAHDLVFGDLQIIHPHIPQPATSAKSAGGFMAIVNSGATDDQLLGIESDIAAKVELHESKVDANGVGTMTKLASIDIPAGGTVSLDHGGIHVMFMGLKDPLIEGEMRKATLIFAKAGRVEIEFMIDPPMGEGEGMDHDGMDHSTMGN
jgi:periplasmic copper chaperone A